MIEERLTALIADAVAAAAPGLGADPPLPVPELQRPRQKGFGDFTTNVAMVLASQAGANPRDTAAAIVDALAPAPFLAKAEVFILAILATPTCACNWLRISEQSPTARLIWLTSTKHSRCLSNNGTELSCY